MKRKFILALILFSLTTNINANQTEVYPVDGLRNIFYLEDVNTIHEYLVDNNIIAKLNLTGIDLVLTFNPERDYYRLEFSNSYIEISKKDNNLDSMNFNLHAITTEQDFELTTDILENILKGTNKYKNKELTFKGIQQSSKTEIHVLDDTFGLKIDTKEQISVINRHEVLECTNTKTSESLNIISVNIVKLY